MSHTPLAGGIVRLLHYPNRKETQSAPPIIADSLIGSTGQISSALPAVLSKREVLLLAVWTCHSQSPPLHFHKWVKWRPSGDYPSHSPTLYTEQRGKQSPKTRQVSQQRRSSPVSSPVVSRCQHTCKTDVVPQVSRSADTASGFRLL